VRGNLRVDAIAFSRDGTRLASGQDDGTLKVWAVQSGENVLTIGAHAGPVVGVAFSPDNAELATASRDGVAKVWDAASGKELLSLGGDGSPLSGVAFSPDARVLATGGRFGIRTYSLAMDDLIQLARARLTRSWRPDECEAYLHTNQCPD
jgi:WD40 repeat protein